MFSAGILGGCLAFAIAETLSHPLGTKYLFKSSFRFRRVVKVKIHAKIARRKDVVKIVETFREYASIRHSF